MLSPSRKTKAEAKAVLSPSACGSGMPVTVGRLLPDFWPRALLPLAKDHQIEMMSQRLSTRADLAMIEAAEDDARLAELLPPAPITPERKRKWTCRCRVKDDSKFMVRLPGGCSEHALAWTGQC